MDRQATLSDSTMTLRALAETDRAALFDAARDPITWAGHPSHDRWQPDVFKPYFDGLLASGETLVAVLNDQIIGCSRFYTPTENPCDIAIGFTFLNHAHWGGTVNRQMKTLMLAHAFARHDTVWFHIAPDNIRSQKATAKFGAQLYAHGPAVVAGTSGIWMTYTLAKSDWTAPQSD